VERGNVARIGWDLGPTLARWMRREDRALHDAWVAQDDGHNGMAQAYHHTILPLASVRDRLTEIRWGLRDFELRLGRPATGMWLPETAVDHLTLRLLAQEGVRWTILAPWQAAGAVVVEQPHRVEADGRHLVAFFYDAALSATLSFDAAATSDADRFARELVEPRLARADGSPPATFVAATDGELYGHHQPFRDLFLARLLDHEDGFRVTTPGAVVDALDPQALETAEVREQTSWSCHHGVARWAGECPDVRDGRWKRPLRGALDRFAAGLDAHMEARFEELSLDLWTLRDRWVDVASGFEIAENWLEREVRPEHLSDADRRSVLRLLAAQASRLQMFASDAWFWGDPRRIETAQALRFAGHAARLMDAELDLHLERTLIEDLRAVRAPDTLDGAADEFAHLRTGDQIYAAALTSIGQPAPTFQ
jgi:Domain of unknown function (DUF3536)/Glycosyl hydrolase family 57